MKKFLLMIIAYFFAFALSAQDLDAIVALINKQKWVESKTAIDKFLADSKNQDKSEAWYFKGKIYHAYSYEKSISNAEIYDLRLKAFEAFKKTQELDTKDLRLKLETYRPYLDLYFGYFDLGAAQFNDKQYMDAYNSFQKAEEIKNFILSKKYEYEGVKLHVLDTALVLNSAIAAGLAKNESLAIPLYRRLVDANVTGPTYQEVYETLVEHYYKNNDEANLVPLVEKAKKFYPDDPYWNDLEIEKLRKTGDKVALMNKYNELLTVHPNSFTLSYNYSVELFNSIYGKDATTKNANENKELLTKTLKVAIANDKGIDATVLMANHLYNMASDISAEISTLKGTSPEAVKKKADLNTKYHKTMDEFIVYGEIASAWFDAQPTLKASQKGNYKGLLSNLSEVYTVKKDLKKASAADAKKNAL
ncbi:MAG: hypothetical protein ABIW38_03795 [Ferruginibacter sp.]